MILSVVLCGNMFQIIDFQTIIQYGLTSTIIKALDQLHSFKNKNAFWTAFVVQSDFQKYAKKAFIPSDVHDNMEMVKDLETAVKKLTNEVSKLNKMDAARNSA